MEKSEKKCFSKEHEKNNANCYCLECKIYMCKKCESLHSQLFKYHKQYEINEDINDIFNGFCKEENHLDILEFYCRNHNKLCCSGCISKIKTKDKGQHTDCDICLIKDIKEDKKNILSKNIINLEEFSKTIDKSIKELKDIIVKLDKNKEDLKIKIQEVFTKIRNIINNREDELFAEVDILYEKTYINNSLIKKLDKLPKEINLYLEKGKSTYKKWNSENVTNSLINDCIIIENMIEDISKVNQFVNKSKSEKSAIFRFYPEKEYDFQLLLSNINKFGKIYKDNYINNNLIENSVYDIEIKTTDKEPSNILIELNGFTNESFNKFYPSNAKFDENDDFIITVCFEGKNINSFDSIFENFNKDNPNGYKDDFVIFLMRKEENKLFIDYKIDRQKVCAINDFLNLFNYLGADLEKLMKFSLILKNNSKVDEFFKMDYEKFYKGFSSVILLIKYDLQNIHQLLMNLEKRKEKLKKKKEEGEELEKKEEFIDVVLLEQLIMAIKFIDFAKDLKIDYNLSQNKLLEYLKESNNKEKFNNFKKKIGEELKDLLTTLNEKDMEILKNCNLDNFSLSLLFWKYKSGVNLKIKAIGLTKVIKDILSQPKVLDFDLDFLPPPID